MLRECAVRGRHWQHLLKVEGNFSQSSPSRTVSGSQPRKRPRGVRLRRSVLPRPSRARSSSSGAWPFTSASGTSGFQFHWPLAASVGRSLVLFPLRPRLPGAVLLVITRQLIFLLFVPTENPSMMKNTQNPNSKYFSPTGRSFPRLVWRCNDITQENAPPGLGGSTGGCFRSRRMGITQRGRQKPCGRGDVRLALCLEGGVRGASHPGGDSAAALLCKEERSRLEAQKTADAACCAAPTRGRWSGRCL